MIAPDKIKPQSTFLVAICSLDEKPSRLGFGVTVSSNEVSNLGLPVNCYTPIAFYILYIHKGSKRVNDYCLIVNDSYCN